MPCTYGGSAPSLKDLRVLLLIRLYVLSIKDATWESAIKKSPEFQITMAKSTNGQDNDRGRVSAALRGTAEIAC